MRNFLLIFMGGGLGSFFRYALSKWVNGATTIAFPYGTFLVNMVGCFFIGFLIFYTERFGTQSFQWRLFLVTGLCGGFTTFSSFSYENFELLGEQRILAFLVYTFGSIALGLLATWFGITVGRNV